MKTGFASASVDIPQDIQWNICGVVAYIITRAAFRFKVYVNHNRKQHCVSDYLLCVKCQVFSDIKEEHLQDIQDMTNEIKFFDSDSESESSSRSSLSDKSPLECTCVLCEEVRSINDRYNSWVPETPIEKSIKNALEKVENQFS